MMDAPNQTGNHFFVPNFTGSPFFAPAFASGDDSITLMPGTPGNPAFLYGHDSITLLPGTPGNQEEFREPASKKPRLVTETASSLIPNPSDLSSSRGPSTLFFKTRICQKFTSGSCNYESNCSFAHGREELRPPPPNWQEQQRLQKPKICRLFESTKSCQYGDSCTFLHVDHESKRESSAISVVRTLSEAEPMSSVNASHQPERGVFPDPIGDSNVSDQKSKYWKTKMCHRWEATGICPYQGNCIYAHGQNELNKLGKTDANCSNFGLPASECLPKPLNAIAQSDAESESNIEAQKKQELIRLKWKLGRKRNGIYADWIDDRRDI